MCLKTGVGRSFLEEEGGGNEGTTTMRNWKVLKDPEELD